LGLNKSMKLKDSKVSGTSETTVTETSVTWATKKVISVETEVRGRCKIV
jgi:hypothetical protein